jgi:hypothetical protein
MWVAETSYVRSGPIRWALRRRLVRLGRRATTLRWYHLPYLFLAGGIMSVMNCLLNVVGTRTTAEPPRWGFCSSMFLVLRPAAGARSPAPAPEEAGPDAAEPDATNVLQKT